MNNTTTTMTTVAPRRGLKVMDTKADLIIGVFVLILSIILTFICCVLMAMKCSKHPKNQYQPSRKFKEPYEEVPQKEAQTTSM